MRIAHRTKGEARPAPLPVAGRAQTWYLDLDQRQDRRLLKTYAEEHAPDDLWTSPSCRVFCGVQRINRSRFGRWRPKGEEQAIGNLAFFRSLHRDQQARGGRSHHEQSATSRAPFDGEDSHTNA